MLKMQKLILLFPHSSGINVPERGFARFPLELTVVQQ